MAGVDGPCLKQKLGIIVLIKTGPAAELLSWQQYDRCRLVSFVIDISGAKFEKHCFNISSYKFSCKPYDVITLLICIKEKRQYL